MIRPHPDPITVSILRHRRSTRTLAVMVALAGTIACGSEGTTGPPSPDLAASAKELTVPTGVSLMLQSEMDAARAQIEKQRVSNNEVAWMSYIDEYTESQDQWLPAPQDPEPAPPPPDDGPGDCKDPTALICPYSAPGGGRKGSGGSGGVGAMFYDDTWSCKDLHDKMYYYYVKFRGNYKLFWLQALTGQHYENFMPGGTVDAMNYYTRQMSFTYYAYRDNGCQGRPPRGGFNPSKDIWI